MSAFAQVTITGVMDAGYQTGKEYGQSAQTVVQNGSRTTAIKFIGVEDLGSGLKAKFQFEADPAITAANGNNNNAAISNVTTKDATTGTITNGVAQKTGQASAQSGLVGNGYNYVGIESTSAGEFQFGTLNTNTLDTQGLVLQKFGTAIGSGYKKTWADLTRFENSFKYISPLMSGFRATYLTGIGNDSTYGSTTTVVLRRPIINEIGLNYDQGPVSVKFSNLTSKTSANEAAATSAAATSASVTTTYNSLGASYDFGVAKVAYGIQNAKNNAGADTSGTDHSLNTKAQNLTVSAPVGVYTFLANMGNRQTNTTSVVALNGTKSTFTGLGAHYNFSKNTYAYLMYERATMNDVDMTAVIINGVVQTAQTGMDRTRNVTAIGISSAF